MTETMKVRSIPMSRFKFFTDNKRVVVAEFTNEDGKKFIGKALCADSDEFNFETGKALAAIRCEVKLRKYELKYAEEWSRYCGRLYTYYAESFKKSAEKVELREVDLKFAEDKLKFLVEQNKN